MSAQLESWNDGSTKDAIINFVTKVAADYAKGDPSGVFTLVTGLAEVLEGITVEDFEADVLDFLCNAQDVRFKKPYKDLTYSPMVELVHYLQDNGFQVYITSQPVAGKLESRLSEETDQSFTLLSLKKE